jgi:hypothetical protein
MSENPALTTTDRELLDAVRAVSDAHDIPVATSTEVTEKVELGANSARMRLNDLVEEGRLSKTKRGRDALYYFDDDVENETVIPPDLEEHVAGYAERQDMRKYEALRDITETGLRYSLTEEKLDGGVTDSKSFSAVFALGMLTVTSWAAAGLAAALSFGGAARTLGVLGFVCVVVAAVVGVAGSRIENMLS